MKIRLFVSVIVTLVALNSYAFAGGGLGLFAGFSSPNDEFNNFSTLKSLDKEGVSDFIRDGMSSGYHLGAKIRYAITDNFTFVGSAGWHKLPESNIDVINPNSGDTLVQLQSTQNIIPITAGLNYYLFSSTVGIYAVGELSYNYIYGSIDAPYGDVPVSIDESPTENRVGFGLGAGVDVDLFITTLNLEAKYSIANLIGKEADEKSKNYFSISLGVFF